MLNDATETKLNTLSALMPSFVVLNESQRLFSVARLFSDDSTCVPVAP